MTMPPKYGAIDADDSLRLSVHLRQALIAASAAHLQSIDALRDASCNYLESLENSGVSRASALASLRAFVREQWHALGIRGDEAVLDRLPALCVESWGEKTPR